MFNFERLPGLLILLATFQVQAGEAPEWRYSGDLGPEHWGDLAEEYTLCKWGVNQSPVDIRETVDAELPALEFDYSGQVISILNNGHTLQLGVTPGNFLRVDGQEFELKQFHVHAPSEHQVDGKLFLMETHLVHANDKGELAVVAKLHKAGEFNDNFAWLGASASATKGEQRALPEPHRNLSGMKLKSDYFRYNGSLTTPPCSEGVRWFVIREPSEIGVEQQAAFFKLIGDAARGPQPINARVILH